MSEANLTLPEPFGKLMPQALWQQIFDRIRILSPELNIYDGVQDLQSRLLAPTALKKKSSVLIVDELVPDIGDEVMRQKRKLLVRAQYYEGGLHHRVSFHSFVTKKVIYKHYPALLLNVLPPLRRVSNLFVAYPSRDKPVYLEIPIEGAPPQIRVIEMDLEKMRAFVPNATQVVPKSRRVDGLRVDFVELGETVVGGEMSLKGRDTVEVTLDPLSAEAGNKFSNYFEKEFTNRHGQRSETALKELRGEEAAALGGAMLKSAIPTATLVIADETQRRWMTNIIKSFSWIPRTFETYAQADAAAVRDITLLVMDARQGDFNAVDLIRKLIDEGTILPIRFVLLGADPTEARPDQWRDLGEGMFIPTTAPYFWVKQKLAKWLNIPEPLRRGVGGEDKPNILIADDDSEMLDMLSLVLFRNNYKVATAATGAEALRQARNAVPKLMLLDINLPDINGLEVLRTLRSFQITRDLPVIMITGYREQEKVKEAISLGIAGYLVKPFSEKDLLQRVEGVLGGIKN